MLLVSPVPASGCICIYICTREPARGTPRRSVDDIELAARLVFGVQGKERDPAPLPYRDVRLPERLRFGYYLSGERARSLFVFPSLLLLPRAVAVDVRLI